MKWMKLNLWVVGVYRRGIWDWCLRPSVVLEALPGIKHAVCHKSESTYNNEADCGALACLLESCCTLFVLLLPQDLLVQLECFHAIDVHMIPSAYLLGYEGLLNFVFSFGNFLEALIDYPELCEDLSEPILCLEFLINVWLQIRARNVYVSSSLREPLIEWQDCSLSEFNGLWLPIHIF